MNASAKSSSRLRLLGAATLVVASIVPVAFLAGGPAQALNATSSSKCPPNKKPTYPPGQCHLTLSSTTIVRGGTVQVSGTGFAANTSVSFTIAASIATGTLTSDQTGSVDGSITLSNSAGAGNYDWIKASGMDPDGFGYALWSDPITIINPKPASDATPVRRSTSSGRALYLVGLLGLLALGSGLAVRRRRRGDRRSNLSGGRTS